MAHEIEFRNGVASFVYAGEPCWHGLGTNVSDDLTPYEIMKKAGLDWNVSKSPAYTMINGEQVELNYSALIRSDDNKILDMVSNDWEPCQNETAFSFFNEFIAANKLKMHTAGSLKGGKRVFALAKTSNGFSIGGKDDTEQYLLFSNPHEYGFTITIMGTDVRVVCNNTLTKALNTGSKNMFKANHRNVFNEEEAKLALNLAGKAMEKYKEQAEFLAAKCYTVESMKEYFTKLFPVTGANKRGKEMSIPASKIIDIIDVQPGANLFPGTFWNAFNAVTFYSDHMAGRDSSGQDNRAYNALYGKMADKKQEALKLALKMAEAA